MNPLALLGLGGLGATYLVGRSLYELGRPSQGASIRADAHATALLVLDMQEAFTGPQAAHPLDAGATSAALTRIDALAHLARLRGWLLADARRIVRTPRRRLALRVAGAPLPPPTSPAYGRDRRLELGPTRVFEREPGDALGSPELDEQLRRASVGRLVLAGLDGAGSVQRTARAALQRGYRVVLVEDAILSAFPDDWRRWRERLLTEGATSLAAGSDLETSL